MTTPSLDDLDRPERDTVRDSVPNAQASDQAKGHTDTQDTGTEGRDLLAGIRTGDWLDSQTFPPLRYSVPGVVPEGLSLLVGPPKAGKSWLALAILLAVASGGHALGKLPVGPPRRVLYLALEDGDRRMQDRCRHLLSNDHRPDDAIPALFTYLTHVDPGMVFLTIAAYLEQYPDTALVVVDTLGKVTPDSRPNETTYSRDYRLGSTLKAIADARPGLAVMALHHDRKAHADDFVERVSGTHGLAGAADTIIVLSRQRQSRDGLLAITGRDIPEGEYAITVSGAGTWELDGGDLEAAAKTARERHERSDGLSDRSTELIAFVAAAGPEGVTRGEVIEAFGENTARYLARRVDEGRLVKLARGRYAVPDPGTSVPSVPLSFSQVSDVTERDSVPNSVPLAGWAAEAYDREA
jgi:hypothetical protein